MDTERKPGKFHISVASSLAAFLLFAGLQSVLLAGRDPLAHAIMRLFNGLIHSNALKIREMPTDWVYIVGTLSFGLIFIIAAVILGAWILRKKTKQTV